MNAEIRRTSRFRLRRGKTASPAGAPFYAAVALIAVLALGLRLYGAGAESYWVDEAFSVIHIREGLGRIFAAGFSYETNPPLYYTLLWAWVAVFGDGEFATRSLSAIFGALTVPVIAATGRVLAGARAGCLAALLFALSVIEIEHGHETRQYALMALALSIALLGMAKALAERREDGAPPYGACAVFAGGIALAVYSHDVAVVYWFAMNLCLLVYLFASGHEKSDLPKAGRFLRSWAVCNLAALLLSSPQLYAIFVMREAPGVAWIPPIPAAWWIALWSFLRITLFSVLPWDGPIRTSAWLRRWPRWAGLRSPTAIIASSWCWACCFRSQRWRSSCSSAFSGRSCWRARCSGFRCRSIF